MTHLVLALDVLGLLLIVLLRHLLLVVFRYSQPSIHYPLLLPEIMLGPYNPQRRTYFCIHLQQYLPKYGQCTLVLYCLPEYHLAGQLQLTCDKLLELPVVMSFKGLEYQHNYLDVFP